MSYYELWDTHNDMLISRHRKGITAMKARIRHCLRIAAIHGKTAYIPTEIRKNGKTIESSEYCELIDELERIGFNCRPLGGEA
jgi:hypothetical protein